MPEPAGSVSFGVRVRYERVPRYELVAVFFLAQRATWHNRIPVVGVKNVDLLVLLVGIRLLPQQPR